MRGCGGCKDVKWGHTGARRRVEMGARRNVRVESVVMYVECVFVYA